MPSSRYDRLAYVYRPLEWIAFRGDLMAARRMLIDELGELFQEKNQRPARSFLFLGDGDGRLIAQFRDRYPDANYVSIDSSSRMLRRQRNRFEAVDGSGKLETICVDVYDWKPPPEAFDVVVAPFFLDCFSEAQLRRFMPTVVSSLQELGVIYYADFDQPVGRWQRIYAGMMLGIIHHFFRVVTELPNRSFIPLDPIFRELGYTPQVEKRLHADMMVARLYTREPTNTGSNEHGQWRQQRRN